MARFYSNENFPRRAVEALQELVAPRGSVPHNLSLLWKPKF
jgi:hypothetical protein